MPLWLPRVVSLFFLATRKRLSSSSSIKLLERRSRCRCEESKRNAHLTHDLLANILRELGTKIERAVISDLKCGTCYARLVLTVENELKQKKIMEIDARPSDCIAVATAQRAPIYVSLNVWEELEDMTEALRKLEAEGLPREKNGGEGVS